MAAKELRPPLEGSVIEGISKVLGHTDKGLTGPEIAKFLQEVNIHDTDPIATKWKRLYNAFVTFQNSNQVSNNILTFINRAMNPARFIGKQEQYDFLRNELNKRLAFIGLQLTEKGKFQKTDSAKTISDAEQKVARLKSKLEQRGTHPTIYQYCRAELLVDNYFHTVFEATKSVAEIIRQRTGLTDDGAELVEKAFSIKNPLIKINDLSNETRESEHKGFSNLIKGVFGMFRNTTAHAPKAIWDISEQDALDILSTISLIHRRLDVQSTTQSM